MDKEVILQVRMDPEDKRKAEELYKELGTSFEEAVRIFAKQSILENGMPFRMVIPEKEAEPVGNGLKKDSGVPAGKKATVRESVSTDFDESYISGSCGGFSAEMAIEKALADKHGREETD